MYKSYDSCLDNFDFTNCKYVLFLENNEFSFFDIEVGDTVQDLTVTSIDLFDENELFGKHKYTGKFKNGKFNGKGKIEYSKPVKTNYVGEFYNNKMHGKGTRIAINKKKKIKMVGVFKANQMYEGHLTSDEIVFSGNI